MSPQDKATLAEMRRFSSLPPEEKYEILKQQFPGLFSAQADTPGEKFARVIDGLYEFLLSLFGVDKNRNQPAPER
jgi:hypothetical protein